VDREDLLDGFDFQDQGVVYDDVGFEVQVEALVFAGYGEFLLSCMG
jgi:hypothetical protein